MTFINERVPAEDFEKYKVDQVNRDKRFHSAGIISQSWTIDRERNIYLRKIGGGGHASAMNKMTWSFFWKGELLVVKLALMDHSGRPGGPGWTHWKIRQFDIPEHLQDRKAEILADLESALVGYKDGGIYSRTTDYRVTLEQ